MGPVHTVGVICPARPPASVVAALSLAGFAVRHIRPGALTNWIGTDALAAVILEDHHGPAVAAALPVTPGFAVVAVAEDTHQLRRLRAAGVRVVLPPQSTPDTIARAVTEQVAAMRPARRRDAERSPRLTTTDRALVRLLVQGRSTTQIAYSLGLSTRTAERRLTNLYRRLGVRGRAEAVWAVMHDGLGATAASAPGADAQAVPATASLR